MTKTVDALKRDETTRKMIPAAVYQYQSVLQKAEQNPVRVVCERRNRDLDPKLVSRGEDEQDWSDLDIHAAAFYTQEKVYHNAMIDDLLRESRTCDCDFRKLESMK